MGNERVVFGNIVPTVLYGLSERERGRKKKMIVFEMKRLSGTTGVMRMDRIINDGV